MRLTTCLNLPAPGRRQCLYVALENGLADTCVFVKQSLDTILCGPLAWAPLIPKLRGHFAEFLLRKSLEHLRLLASPTCVGLRYGQRLSWFAKLFLAACVDRPLRNLAVPSASPLDYPRGFSCGETSTWLTADNPPTRRRSCSCVPPRTRNGQLLVREC